MILLHLTAENLGAQARQVAVPAQQIKYVHPLNGKTLVALGPEDHLLVSESYADVCAQMRES